VIFYHCTDRVWDWPHQLHLPRSRNDIPVIPVLFANSVPQSTYGNRAYGFELSEDTVFLSMSNKVYSCMRESPEYRAGAYDTARRLGVDALFRTQTEGDTTLCVINFDRIINWSLTQ